MKIKAPTVYDVAKIAGVSPSTVSRYLNRTTYVSKDKSIKIEQAIKSLSYKPAVASQTQSQRRTMTIGVLVQHPDSPFTCRILNDMEKYFDHLGYSLIIATGQWDSEHESQALNYLEKCNVDGVIIVTGNLSDEKLLQFSEKIPTVAFGYNLEAENLRSINIDNELGGYMATLHLLQQGHTAIAHIKGIDDQPDSQQRLKGYQRALLEAGIPLNKKLVVSGDFSCKQGYQQTLALLRSRNAFTALFAANDQMAFGAIKALHDNNIHVPNDVSVIGFDDIPTSEYFTPALTTLRQPIEEVGTTCAKAIINLLNQRNETLYFPPIDLIVRDSTLSRFY